MAPATSTSSPLASTATGPSGFTAAARRETFAAAAASASTAPASSTTSAIRLGWPIDLALEIKHLLILLLALALGLGSRASKEVLLFLVALELLALFELLLRAFVGLARLEGGAELELLLRLLSEIVIVRDLLGAFGFGGCGLRLAVGLDAAFVGFAAGLVGNPGPLGVFTSVWLPDGFLLFFLCNGFACFLVG